MLALSLSQFVSLTQALGIQGASLFSDTTFEKIMPSALAERIKSHLATHKMTKSEFANQVGYDIASTLEDHNGILEWNIDCLRSVCSQIGVNWLSALPA